MKDEKLNFTFRDGESSCAGKNNIDLRSDNEKYSTFADEAITEQVEATEKALEKYRLEVLGSIPEPEAQVIIASGSAVIVSGAKSALRKKLNDYRCSKSR